MNHDHNDGSIAYRQQRLSRRRSVLPGLSMIAALAIGLVTTTAQARSCPYRPDGNLNWKDIEGNVCDGDPNDNDRWSAFSGNGGNWNDRADDFWNDGTKQTFDSVCLYKDKYYGPNGASNWRLLKRGQYKQWRNIVSSNKWVRSTATTCNR